MHRRLCTLVTVAAMAGMLAGPAPSQAADSPSADSAASLRWGACPPAPPGVERDSRQECATLRVPLDHRHPRGAKIDIAVSRIVTAKPGLRRGILLFNPGGPGGSGLDFPGQLAPALPAAVLDRYDLIGFDPRGIGHSTPVSCGIPLDTEPDLQLPFPAPDGSIDRNVAFARTTAEGCAAHSGRLLPYITTANTARDMDGIRAALHERQLSYLGYSYGSYLGAVYTTLFPQRSDRIILDSAIDPRLVWYDQWRAFATGFALRFPDFTGWAATHDYVYHLGSTPEAVAHTYDAIAARLDQSPVPDPTGFPVNGNLFRLVTFSMLYHDGNFPYLAEIWQYLAGAGGSPAALGSVRDTLAQPPAAEVPADNGRAAQYSVVCDDVDWSTDIDQYRHNVAVDRRMFPRTAGFPANLWPCVFWPNEPAEAPVAVTDRGPRNVLILQNLRDPATPWATGYGLRQTLGQRAAMVSVDQGGHGVYLITDAPCAADVATAFLADGTVPAHDQLCPGQSPAAISAQRHTVPFRLPGPIG